MHERTRTLNRNLRRLASQGGSALIIALVFLLAMTLIGVTAMQGTTQQESMAGNARQRNLAFQASEAALRDGESCLPTLTSCVLIAPTTPDTDLGTFWMNYDWTTQSQLYPVTAGGIPLDEVIAQPRFVIEELPPVSRPPGPGESVRFGALPQDQFFRVTARGLGGTADAVGILQTSYKR